MKKFSAECIKTDSTMYTNLNEVCSFYVLDKIGISVDGISQCVRESFEEEANYASVNQIFKIDRDAYNFRTVRATP